VGRGRSNGWARFSHFFASWVVDEEDAGHQWGIVPRADGEPMTRGMVERDICAPCARVRQSGGVAWKPSGGRVVWRRLGVRAQAARVWGVAGPRELGWTGRGEGGVARWACWGKGALVGRGSCCWRWAEVGWAARGKRGSRSFPFSFSFSLFLFFLFRYNCIFIPV
jgi:hypothetical protein